MLHGEAFEEPVGQGEGKIEHGGSIAFHHYATILINK